MVIRRIVPIEAPFVNVVTQIIEAQAVRRTKRNTVWALFLPTSAVAFEDFRRIESLNSSPLFIECLAELVKNAVKGEE